MSNELLLDRQSRYILATFLLNSERPLLIDPDDFRAYQKGDLVTITFNDLGEIVDVVGPSILDALDVRSKL